MNILLKLKWVIIPLLLIAAMLVKQAAPDYQELVREKGQPSIPSSYSSVQAQEILDRFNHKPKDSTLQDILVVYHADTALSDAQLGEIKTSLGALGKQSGIPVAGMENPFENETLKEQLLSKDGTTLLAPLTVDTRNEKLENIRVDLDEYLDRVSTPHYLTGGPAIQEDTLKSTGEGVKKTEWITVAFVLLVLGLTFRSPTAPLVSLFVIGLTYVGSLSLVSILADKWGFPLSSVTQSFLIMVLFGIGTDYNILLFMRFKEELTRQESVLKAIQATYRTAGKTVFYSILVVIIGFSTLLLSQFSVFQSAGAVAIAVCLLLLALFTATPVLMAIFGGGLFWPSKKLHTHKENKLWTLLGKKAVAAPIVSLLIVLIVTVPNVFLYKGVVSFNSVAEVNPSYDSIKGYHFVSDAFTPGQAAPTAFMLESGSSLDTAENLSLVDQITETIAETEGVKQVFSATRPKGEKLDQFYVSNQSKEVSGGLDKANDGIKAIQSGLTDASAKLDSASLSAQLQNMDRLLQGTKTIGTDLGKISDGLAAVESGMKQGANGADSIAGGLMKLEQSSRALSSSSTRLLTGYQEIRSGLQSVHDRYASITSQLNASMQLAAAVQSASEQLAKTHPELSRDPDYMKLSATGRTLHDSLGNLHTAMTAANDRLGGVLASLDKTNQGLNQLVSGQKKMGDGLAQLEEGAASLSNSLQKGTGAQQQIVTQMAALKNGIDQIDEGQSKLQAGLGTLDASLQDLETGLKKSADGLGSVSGGLTDAQHYLNQLAASDTTTFFAPNDALQNDAFKKALNAYLSTDKKIAKWTIVLDSDPYSTDAIATINRINRNVKNVLDGTKLSSARYGAAGVTGQNASLQVIEQQDFSRTVLLMLGGIAIALAVMFRSLLLPIYVIASLILAYFTSIHLTELMYTHGFSHAGLSWAVPFFSFILLIALGVDYSIFLLMRFREYRDEPPKAAIVKALKHMGSVITSAVIILIGTFGALYPSGVLILIQLATIVIIGLILLALVLLPLFLPALIALGSRKNEGDETLEEESTVRS
ncbi:MMPL family transporter [Paenibacillus humicola]|uniref:MMPL family transporter n=1 Tax=Paenibacillus humicola TaxID=3110540 RepID=UPI00237BBB1D|nr:MMPL family transporter [Paenibacillus humicola]